MKRLVLLTVGFLTLIASCNTGKKKSNEETGSVPYWEKGAIHFADSMRLLSVKEAIRSGIDSYIVSPSTLILVDWDFGEELMELYPEMEIPDTTLITYENYDLPNLGMTIDSLVMEQAILLEILLSNYDLRCDALIDKIILKDSSNMRGYLTISHCSGFDSYLLEIRGDTLKLFLAEALTE